MVRPAQETCMIYHCILNSLSKKGRKPLRGSQRPIQNGFTKNLRQTKSLNQGSGTVRIVTVTERHPVANVTDATVATMQRTARARPKSSIQERTDVLKMKKMKLAKALQTTINKEGVRSDGTLSKDNSDS